MDAMSKEEGNGDQDSPLIIGKLTHLEGAATIVSSDGRSRVLHTGDAIYLGDKLQIPGSGAATIQLVNGAIYTVTPGSPITFDPNTLKHITAQAFPEETPHHHGTLMAYHGEMGLVSSGFLTHPCGYATPGHSLVVGTVDCAEGFVTAVGADGATRILTAGDPIYSGDVITTTTDSTAKIHMNDGADYNVQPGDTFTGATEDAGACASSEGAYEPGIELTYLPVVDETGFVSSGFDTGNYVNVVPVPVEFPTTPVILIPPPVITPPVVTVPTPTPVADLSIVKTDNETNVIPGTTDTYTIVVTNNGPSAVSGASVVDILSSNPDISSDTWSAVVSSGASITGGGSSGSGNINDTVNLASGSTITYTITADISPGATGTLSNTATVTPPSGVTDNNLSNNTSTVTNALTPQADITITKTDNVGGSSITDTPGSTIPGDTITYTVDVTNGGPSAVTNATITDLLGSNADILSDSWTATVVSGTASGFSASGSGSIDDTAVNLGADSEIAYTVTAEIKPGATGTLSNTATITLPSGETNTGNSSATDTDTLTPHADITITKTDNVGGSSITDTTGSAIPGDSITYTIDVTNGGPSAVTNATITDLLGSNADILSDSWTATVVSGTASGFSASGSGSIDDTAVNLGAGSEIAYTVTAEIAPGATGTLSNTASIALPSGDVNTGNSSATDTDTLTPHADITITKVDNLGGSSITDSTGTAIPGDSITYTIDVTNGGPSAVTNATISDLLGSNADILSDSWTAAVVSGTASGFSASGSGSIDDTAVNLGAGSEIAYTVTAEIAPSATGTLSNTASIGLPSGDVNTGNSSATDTDTLTPHADITITKVDNLGGSSITDTTGSAIPGDSITYTIDVTNGGPSAVTNATISDLLGSNADILSDSWTAAVVSGTASGFSASGSGSIDDTAVNLGAGSEIAYTITAEIAPGATGTLSNTASIGLPSGDVNTGNSSATDTDTLTPHADITITKVDNLGGSSITDTTGSAIPGDSITYTIDVTNGGPSAVTNATITDLLGSNADILSDSWTATVVSGTASGFSASGSGSIDDTAVNLGAGSEIAYTVTAEIAPSATGTLSNTASIALPSGDVNTGNSSATDTDTLTPQADLSIFKSDNVGGEPVPGTNDTGGGSAVPGTTEVYTVVVSNNGPSDANGATVNDIIPAGISSDNWSATFTGGASIVGNVNSGTGNINDTVNLPAGSTITYTIDANVASNQETMLGLLNNASSTTDVQNAWSGATLYGYDFGQTYESDGTLTLGTPNQLVAYNVGGVGVSGTDGYNLPGPDEINHLANDNSSPSDSQTLVVALNNSASSATIEVNDQISNEDNGAGEYGEVTAYNAQGQQIGSPIVFGNENATIAAAFGSDFVPVNYNSVTDGSTDQGTFTITSQMVGGDFSYLVFSALPYGAGVLGDSISYPDNDSSDYLVQSINYTNASLVNTATVTAPSGVTDTNLSNNSSTDTQTVTPVADLSIVKTDNETNVIPGTTDTYTIVVTNNGPSAIMGASVVDSLLTNPDITGDTWTATGTAGASNFSLSGSGNIDDTVNLQSGASITYIVTADISPTATGTLTNTATVEPPSGATDPNPNNNSSAVTNVLTPEADISITKVDNLGGSSITDTTGSAIPGDSITYTIDVTNGGPSAVTNATISDLLGSNADILSDSWTAAVVSGTASGFSASGSGSIDDTAVNLGAGSEIAYMVTAEIKPGVTGTLSNTATITLPSGETNTGNSSATDKDTLTPVADLSIFKSDNVGGEPIHGTNNTGGGSVAPGGTEIYTVVVTNSGPSAADGAKVSDIIPSGISSDHWSAVVSAGSNGVLASITSGGSSGTGNINDTVNLPAGSTITYTIDATIGSNQTMLGLLNNASSGTAVQNAWTGATLYGYDIGQTYESGGVLTLGTPNQLVAYDTNGVGVTGTGGMNLQVPDQINHEANDSSNPADSQTLVIGLNNSASSATIEVNNLFSTEDNNAGEYGEVTAYNAQGQQVGSPIVFGNENATIAATFGSDFVPVNYNAITNGSPDEGTFTITSELVGGDFSYLVFSALPYGAGVPGNSIDYPSDDSSDYFVQSINYTNATLVNTATVTAPAGVTDPNLSNNSSTDTTSITQKADLTITNEHTSPSEGKPGTSESYQITVSNTGPSDSPDTTVKDVLPSGFTMTSSEISAAQSQANTADPGTIFSASTSGGITTLTWSNINLTDQTVNFDFTGNISHSYTNSTLVSTATVIPETGIIDTNPITTSKDTLTMDPDVAIKVTDNVSGVFNTGTNNTTGGSTNSGKSEIYTIVVSNNGPANATGATVSDLLPAGISSDSWTAVLSNGASINGGIISGMGNINEIVNLTVGSTITYTINAQIDPGATGNLVNIATVMLPPGVDPNLSNNTSTDTTTLNLPSDLNNNKNDSNAPLVTNNGIFDNGFGNNGSNGNDNNNHGKHSWENQAGDNQHHSNSANFSNAGNYVNNDIVKNSSDNNNHEKPLWNNKEGDNQHNWNPVNFSSIIPGVDHGDKNCNDKGNESCKFSSNGHTLYSQNIIDDYSQHNNAGGSEKPVNLGALLNNLGNNNPGNDGGKDHNKVNNTAPVNAEWHQVNYHAVYAAACNDSSCHEVDHLNHCAETAGHHLHAA